MNDFKNIIQGRLLNRWTLFCLKRIYPDPFQPVRNSVYKTIFLEYQIIETKYPGPTKYKNKYHKKTP